MDKLIQILLILNKYNCNISAEHDILLFWGPYNEETEISDEDLRILKLLGVFYSEEYECLAYFV